MTINSKLRPIIYGLGVFVIFTVLAIALKLITKHTPTETEYFGLISKKDILLGLLLAVVLSFTHERKKKLK